MDTLKPPNYQNENIETEDLNSTQLEKDFIRLKDRELEDRELKIKQELEERFFKTIIVFIDDMDRFELKEMRKKKPIKNS